MVGLVKSELYTCLGSYSIYPCVQWVNYKYCVGVVPIPYLSAIVPYMPDRGVVRGGDSFVDSYIVHPPLIGQAEPVLWSKSCDVLIYFINVPYT